MPRASFKLLYVAGFGLIPARHSSVARQFSCVPCDRQSRDSASNLWCARTGKGLDSTPLDHILEHDLWLKELEERLEWVWRK